MQTPVVRTPAGLVRGHAVAAGVLAWRGIPYAAAPRGAARFEAPRRAERWAGVLDAADFGPLPPQPPGRPGAPSWDPAAAGNPLTVNVWAPERPGPPRPVLIWIYGGGYVAGGADFFLPCELVRAGLVVVTFNYRVGFGGFGHLPGAPGNRGLLDQLAALRWVRAAIAGFGGAPDRITVAGQSAGAGSAAALMVMPAAAGLFQRVIAQSVPGVFFSTEFAASIGREVAAAAGADYTLAGLSGVSDQALVGASAEVAARFRKDPGLGVRHYLPTIYFPVVGPATAPGQPALTCGPLQAAARTRDVALLAQHTLDEFRVFTATGAGPVARTDGELAALGQAFGLSAARLAGYRAAAGPVPAAEVHAMIGTDYLFGEYTARLAEARGRAGAETYLARFAWRSPVQDGALGAAHGMDLPFSFGDLRTGPAAALAFGGASPATADEALARRMLACWVAFASGRDPGWPPVTGTRTPVRIWDHADRLAEETAGWRRSAWSDVPFEPLR